MGRLRHRLGRFETGWLARPENFGTLADLPGQWADVVHQRRQPRSPRLTWIRARLLRRAGRQCLQSPILGCTCYHRLFVFNQLADLERWRAAGAHHSGDGRGLRHGRDQAPGRRFEGLRVALAGTFYARRRVGLLHDKTRRPGQRPLPPALFNRVIELTLAEPPGDTTDWTGRAMAAEAGTSLRSVQRIWAAHGPQRTERGALSRRRIQLLLPNCATWSGSISTRRHSLVLFDEKSPVWMAPDSQWKRLC